MEDVRSNLEETDFGTFMQDEPSPLLVSTIVSKCYEKLADEFKYVKAQTVEPLTTFLEFIQRDKMIDNVCMVLQGALNNKPPADLEDKINPLGDFNGLRTVMNESFIDQSGFDEVYRIFLYDTPIGPYFEEYLKVANAAKDEMPKEFEHNEVGGILTNQDLEVMKTALKKAWLEDFKAFCDAQGGNTEEVMGHILSTEADFRVLLITLNALGTDLSTEARKDERNELYPNFGYLFPEGQFELRNAWNETSVRTALEPFTKYVNLYDQVKDFYDRDAKDERNPATVHSLEDIVYKQNTKMYEMAFEQQYHFGIFYAWVKLREQEIRNIRWIANMIVLKKLDRIEDTIVPIFPPRY